MGMASQAENDVHEDDLSFSMLFSLLMMNNLIAIATQELASEGQQKQEQAMQLMHLLMNLLWQIRKTKFIYGSIIVVQR